MNGIRIILASAFVALAASPATAATFVNGGFESGSTTGWTTGEGYRGNVTNNALNPSNVLPSGSLYTGSGNRSGIVSAGTVDPVIGAALGSTVFSGNYSFRAQDTQTGGYASAISQTVLNYTDNTIAFAWKAVLENGGHDPEDSALFRIVLRDNTTGTDILNRAYDAGFTGSGIDNRFTVQGDLYYTANWQLESIAISDSLLGHDFTLSLLAADCLPTGHLGYAYLDGFGSSVNPPPVDPPPTGQVPLPGTLALVGLGFASLAGSRKRKVGQFS